MKYEDVDLPGPSNSRSRLPEPPIDDPFRRTSEPIPRPVMESIAEALVARGLLRTLASLNTASKAVYAQTLPIVWRTFIWDPSKASLKLEEGEEDRYWREMTIDSAGAEYIQ
jgi:hypothetical protein